MRTWIDIDLDTIIANYQTACSLTEARITCVLKANAYGHGMLRVAEALQGAGCRSFAVSCGREALLLRRVGIGGEVLVMAPAEPEELEALVREEITLTACGTEDLTAIDRAAEQAGKTAVVHLKLDTGFHRLGFVCGEDTVRRLAECIPVLPHLRAEGVYSHLGLVTRERDEAQHRAFCDTVGALRRAGLALPDTHLCDSIGLVRYPDWHMSRCRVGAFLFGVRPSGSDGLPFTCREALAFRAKVSRVHEAPAGSVIGYDEAVTDRPLRVATVCAGYGDGYPRCLSHGKGFVLIRGQRAPVLGLVCMDQLMADVTDIPDCRAGDTATLLGGGIPYREACDWANTNRNELLSLLSARPVRVYHRGGRAVTVLDSLLGTREDFAE